MSKLATPPQLNPEAIQLASDVDDIFNNELRLGFTAESLPQFDGSIWRRYEFPDSTFLLTGEGRRLMLASGVGNLLRHYADEAADGRSVDRDIRKFLVEAGNSKVFTVGNEQLVIKEGKADSHPMEPALERMDTLVHIVQTRCPHWIHVPKHYGMFTYKPTGREYMLMQKIDGGVTAGDILGYEEQPPREAHLEQEVKKVFGRVTPGLKQQVRSQFDEMLTLVNDAIESAGLDSGELLPDLERRDGKLENLHNVLVKPATTPVAGKGLEFWLIDQ